MAQIYYRVERDADADGRFPGFNPVRILVIRIAVKRLREALLNR